MSSHLLSSRKAGLALLAAGALLCASEVVEACPMPPEGTGAAPIRAESTAYAPSPSGGLELRLPRRYSGEGACPCPTTWWKT